MSLRYESFPKTILEIIHSFEKGRLNLSPGFQRDSVWTDSDRQKLIESILRGYPLPSVFFYKRETDGQIYFDVIDGKQRIETILRFTGRIRGNRFATKKIQLPGEDEKDWVDWDKLNDIPSVVSFKNVYPKEIQDKVVSNWTNYGYPAIHR